MSWVRLEQALFDNEKIVRASQDTLLLWLASIAYANRVESDGRIPCAALRKIATDAKIYDAPDIDTAVEELLRLNLWERGEQGWWIHDYSVYQQTRDKLAQERERHKKRVTLFRTPEIPRQVKERDLDQCRYCAKVVSWQDKRSGDGATYDHVDPDGPSDVTNVVIACRACNHRKGSRTPAQAGMSLLPPPPPPKNGQALRPVSDEDLLLELADELKPNQITNQNGVNSRYPKAEPPKLPPLPPADRYVQRERHSSADPVALEELRAVRVKKVG